MLKIDKAPKFSALVTVNTAAIKGEFNVHFEALPSDELAELDKGEAGDWKRVLARVVRGFDPVEVCGETVDSTKADELAKLIRWPGVGAAMLAAYYKGLWEAGSGN